jgi:hypothetical protein
MKLENVIRLVSVYTKADRLLKKNRLRKYRESSWQSYVLLAVICLLGVAIGLGVGFYVSGLADPVARGQLREGVVSFFFTLPTMCVLYSLILTQFYQFQRAGTKASTQPVYWFPVTWGEHTMASVIAGMLGTPLYITGFLSCLTIALSIPMGLLPIALLTALALFACMFMTSATTEILKSLQLGVSRVVTKAAGRAAVWVRFFATLLFITAVYVLYFFLTQSSLPALIASISAGQLAAWFIPYVWPGILLYAVHNGLWPMAATLLAGMAIFIAALMGIAVWLNARYGLWEAPAISVSKGAYTPKAGLLGRIGLSAAESAMVKKDFRAYTRRTELMYVFITPIVFIVMTFMPMFTGNNIGSSISGFYSFFYLYLALAPCAILALSLGTASTGSEGASLWVLTSSSLSPRSYVRGKFFFAASLSVLTGLLCVMAGYFLFAPTGRMAVTGVWEAAIMACAVAMVSIYSGIAGADFREAPRPRMVRPEWALINMVVCIVAGILVVSPVIVYGVAVMFIGINAPGSFLYGAWALSGAIALTIAYVSYKMAINGAKRSVFASKE